MIFAINIKQLNAMRPETESKLNRLLWRERLRFTSIVLGAVLLFVAIGGFWLEPWDTGEVQMAEVINYAGAESEYRRATHGRHIKTIVRLADGSEGVVYAPQPRVLFIGERILVREKVSRFLGRRRFDFVGWSK